MHCNTCKSKLSRDKTLPPRYDYFFNPVDATSGEKRCFFLRCTQCATATFYKQLRLSCDPPNKFGLTQESTEKEYWACRYCPKDPPPAVGSTASEYTKRISRGADKYRA